MNKLKPILAVLLNLMIITLSAQTITNVVAKQQGNKVVISYKLQCNESAEISIYLSEKGDGNFTGPLKSVTGDVGSGITSGIKTITWNTVQDTDQISGDKIVFRVKGQIKFGTFTDKRDNKTYKWVKIGTQTIMAVNFAYVPSHGKYWPHDKSDRDLRDNGNKGYLYDWETAKEIVPNGWHLPSKDEWDALYNFLGGNYNSVNESLKKDGNSGFDLLTAGYINFETGQVYGGGAFGFWSSTPYNQDHIWGFFRKSQNNFSKTMGYSIRYFKD